MPNRRTFLQLTAAGCALPAATRADDHELRMPARVLDTHTHFYDVNKPGGIPWPSSKDPLLYRSVMPGEFQSLTAPYHVHGTVVIEAVWPVEDNQWALDTLAPDPLVPGIIGRLPLEGTQGADAASFETLAERFAAHPKFKGLRINNRRVARALKPDFLPAYEWMAKHNWTVDVLGNAAMLPDVLALARKLPDLHIVIDHLPFNPIKGKEKEMEDALDGLGKMPNVFAKVSNVLRKEHGPRIDEVDLYRPQLDALWRRFGNKRVIYGSNWPVSDRIAPYHAVFGVMQKYLADHSIEESDDYFWNNGVRAYRLES